MVSGNFLYAFLDEGGDFNFSPRGSAYFTITSLSLIRPFKFYGPLSDLKYDLIESGLNLERFHACEDKQNVRDKVFRVIKEALPSVAVDSVIVEKRKTHPSLRDEGKFYPKMVGYLVQCVCNIRNLGDYAGVVIITDTLPIKKKRKAIEEAVKTTLAPLLKPIGKPYWILHHDSKSSFGLQAVDYCNWAIFRRWERKDIRSYECIKDAIRSEFDIFERGQTYYY